MTLRLFFKLFFRDITYSFSYGKYKYVIFLAMTILLTVSKSLELKATGANSVDIFFSLLKDNGYIERLSDYRVPFYWDFIQFFCLFLIGDFLFQDVENNRIYVLMRCQSKLIYISSKLIWIIVQNLVVFVGLFAVIYVVSSLVLGDLTFKRSHYFKQFIEPMMVIKVTPEQLLLHIILGFILTGIVLSGIQLLCIQFLTPILAFFGLIMISSISTFSSLKFLPAIHSMILKQDIFNHEHHLTFSFTIVYCAVLYLIVSTLTLLVFKKKDYL